MNALEKYAAKQLLIEKLAAVSLLTKGIAAAGMFGRGARLGAQGATIPVRHAARLMTSPTATAFAKGTALTAGARNVPSILRAASKGARGVARATGPKTRLAVVGGGSGLLGAGLGHASVSKYRAYQRSKTPIVIPPNKPRLGALSRRSGAS